MNARRGLPIRSIAESAIPGRIKDVAREALAAALEGRVTTYKELAERSETDVWFFDGPRRFEFTAPEYDNGLPDEIDRLVGNHEAHRPFVLEVPDVELIGHQCMKLTADRKYIIYSFWEEATRDASRELAYDVLDALSFGTWPFPSPGMGDPITLETAVPLLNRWATNYSHWTEECLTQLQGLEHYIEETGEQPIILIPPDPPAFIPASLDAFGHTDADYRELPAERVHVERLVLPSIRRCRSGTSEDYIREVPTLGWVRDRVLEGIPDGTTETGPDRLFISREDAATRRVVNRDEVEETLGELGFETRLMTELSFVEQKHLIRDVDMIVAPHGAGLTELIYAEDTAVLELFGSYVVPPYFEMAKGLGHRYGCLRCEPVGDDMRVDIDELLEGVRTLEAAS